MNHTLKAYEQSPNHPEIAGIYSNLGMIYCNIGEYKEAIKCLQKSLAIGRKVYEHSPNHPNLAGIYNNLKITENLYTQSLNGKIGTLSSEGTDARFVSPNNDNKTNIKRLFHEKDKYHTTDICRLLEIKEFDKVKQILKMKETNNESLLNQLAYNMCDSNYRDKYSISKEVAQIVFGEARDQLELLGADITDIIEAYNL